MINRVYPVSCPVHTITAWINWILFYSYTQFTKHIRHLYRSKIYTHPSESCFLFLSVSNELCSWQGLWRKVPLSADLLHLTAFIKSRWWAANPDSRGCDGKPVQPSKLIKTSRLISGEWKDWLWEGRQARVCGQQYPNRSNVSIMGCEHSGGHGMRWRGTGSWEWDEEGEMRNEEWCAITEMVPPQMGLQLGVSPGRWLLMWCQKSQEEVSRFLLLLSLG